MIDIIKIISVMIIVPAILVYLIHMIFVIDKQALECSQTGGIPLQDIYKNIVCIDKHTIRR